MAPTAGGAPPLIIHQMLTRLADFINRTFTAAQRLFEITDSDQEIADDPDAVPMDSTRGEFVSDQVHFGYLKDQPVLKGLEFDVKAGEMIGLVGKSGIGKTPLQRHNSGEHRICKSGRPP